jgi:hypothetical protein
VTQPLDSELLRFLYDKRLELFNYRRGIEWRVFFGAATLYAALDAAFVTQRITLAGYFLYGWWAACALLLLAVWRFSSELQLRNHADRAAMNEMQGRLCDQLGLPKDSRIRERVEVPAGSLSEDGYWAYRWQLMVLAILAVISAVLPTVISAVGTGSAKVNGSG